MINWFRTFFVVLFLCVNIYSQNYTWSLKVTGTSIGNPIDVYQFNKNHMLYGTGNSIYKSWNRGESFTKIGTSIPSATQVKNIIVSEKDTSTFLVAINIGSTYQVVKTTNRGDTWTTTGTFVFSYYGIPTTKDPAHPDTIYLMDGTGFKVSTDFGSTWTTRSTPGTNSAPCDIEVFPDSSNIILIGDNGTGIFRSTDYGFTWSQRLSTSGEIPTMACDRKTKGLAWATKWSGGGGILKSTDYGNTWTLVTFFNTLNMWGVDVSPNESKYLAVGQYSGNKIYISRDTGATWQTTTTSGSNYSVYIVDTSTVFCAQSTGLYKLIVPANQTPVELSGFSASTDNNTVILKWNTATELNNRGFEIERSVNSSLFEKIGFVPGFGTTTNEHFYNFKDVLYKSAKVSYRLKQVDYDGKSDYSSIVESEIILPDEFSLSQNFPNPFNPETKIKFSLPSDSHVKISLFNILGNKVKEIINNNFAKGVNEINLLATGLSSGTYFYRIDVITKEGNYFSDVKKLTYLK